MTLRPLLNRVLPKGDFARSVATLATGTIAAQVIVYASRPLLTRLYTQEDFGILAVILSITAILAAVASARYEDAVMLPEEERDGLNVLALSGGLIVISAVLSVAIVLFSEQLALLFRTPALAYWLFIIPILVAGICFTRLLELWYTRTRKFRLVSTGRVVQGTSATVIQIGAGLAGAGVAGLMLGYVAGLLAVTVLMGIVFLARYGDAFRQHVNLPDVKRMGHRYADFARYSSPATLLNGLSLHLPKLLLLYFFSAEVVGFYWLAYGMLVAPAVLVGQSVAQVFFVRAAEAHRSNRLTPITVAVFDRLLLVGIFPATALVIAGPEVFAVIFGEDWRESGVYAQYLAPWILFSTIASPLSRLFDILERQRADLLFSIFTFVLQIGALVTGAITGNHLTTLLFFGGAGALSRLIHMSWILNTAGVAFAAMAFRVMRALGIVIPWILLLLLVQSYTAALGTTISFILCAVGYFGTLLLPRFQWRK